MPTKEIGGNRCARMCGGSFSANDVGKVGAANSRTAGGPSAIRSRAVHCKFPIAWLTDQNETYMFSSIVSQIDVRSKTKSLMSDGFRYWTGNDDE